MRNTIVPLLALVLATAATAGTTPAPPSPDPPATPMSAPVYVLSGGGYGHGVGLNQYGALGQAKANRTYQDILSFYYPGTTISPAPLSTVRVLIADGRPAVEIDPKLLRDKRRGLVEHVAHIASHCWEQADMLVDLGAVTVSGARAGKGG